MVNLRKPLFTCPSPPRINPPPPAPAPPALPLLYLGRLHINACYGTAQRSSRGDRPMGGHCKLRDQQVSGLADKAKMKKQNNARNRNMKISVRDPTHNFDPADTTARAKTPEELQTAISPAKPDCAKTPVPPHPRPPPRKKSTTSTNTTRKKSQCSANLVGWWWSG